MNKKQKKMLTRIIIAAVLMIAFKVINTFVDIPTVVLFIMYMVPYLVIGYDILRKAIKGILNRQVFDENFLMAVATVRQRHLRHIAVGAVFGHRDPVPGAQHVVGRELHAGDQPQDAVPENQHDDGRRSAQSREYGRGVLPDEDADNENRPDAYRQQLDHLVNAFQRTVAQRLVACDLRQYAVSYP